MRLAARLMTVLACAVASPGSANAQNTASVSAPGAAAGQRPVVMELFTSQGCSSCPPADALLKTYAERPGIMALSLGVDYWDHLGWKDTLASPKHTARQKNFAKALGTGNIYTPQLVLDGVRETVGSNKGEIEKALALVRKQPAAPVPMTAVLDGNRVVIDVGAAAGQPATVWLAIVSPRVEVEIKRGENRGRKISYHNVVLDIAPVGMWSGKAMKIELPASALMQPGDRCAVLLQADDGGRIVAAAWMTP